MENENFGNNILKNLIIMVGDGNVQASCGKCCCPIALEELMLVSCSFCGKLEITDLKFKLLGNTILS